MGRAFVVSVLCVDCEHRDPRPWFISYPVKSLEWTRPSAVWYGCAPSPGTGLCVGRVPVEPGRLLTKDSSAPS